MNAKSRISPYFCHIIGESPERASRFHNSTIKRTEAFAIAIHIPVFVWVITGYLIAHGVFDLERLLSASIAFGCGLLVYLVERLVLSTPKARIMTIGRLVIGLVIALLGASAVDLVIFEREIEQQLVVSKRLALEQNHQNIIASESELVQNKKLLWQQAQEAAHCEANGTCGSRIRSVGPVYRELARHADFLKGEYVKGSSQLDALYAAKEEALAAFDKNPPSSKDSGLLSRVQALHDYVKTNLAAFIAWLLFFLLVLFFELMVVFCKILFGETVDDELEQIRETISQEKARSYRDAVLNPQASTLALIDSSYN
jgi:hypothetical protein